ncbi:hypothetical protein FQN60_001653 [Etheostoma spectabile]|uniref:Uncharacterized protein n=1 Tax=Etheostoma spectabile TaxID=54343 RepID=A0A5J5D4R3_9PERO|nr:hypothetical protein FQN60_001653 [Etheostoma spectabile]
MTTNTINTKFTMCVTLRVSVSQLAEALIRPPLDSKIIVLVVGVCDILNND